MGNKVIVRWRIRGTLAIDGIALLRAVGDEDVVDARLAKKMAVCGQVEIVGNADELGCRELPDIDIEDIEMEEEEIELDES